MISTNKQGMKPRRASSGLAGRLIWPGLACLGLLLLGACKDDEEVPVTPLPPVNINITASLADIQAQVFSPICASHHSGPTPSGGLNLSSTAAVFARVGTTDSQGNTIILAGNPNLSSLTWKLEGVDNFALPVFGSRMPLGGPFLSQSTIDVIRQWIANGALNN